MTIASRQANGSTVTTAGRLSDSTGLAVSTATDGTTLLELLAQAEKAYHRYRFLVVDRAVPGRPLDIAQRQALREHELAEQALSEYRRRNYS